MPPSSRPSTPAACRPVLTVVFGRCADRRRWRRPALDVRGVRPLVPPQRVAQPAHVGAPGPHRLPPLSARLLTGHQAERAPGERARGGAHDAPALRCPAAAPRFPAAAAAAGLSGWRAPALTGRRVCSVGVRRVRPAVSTPVLVPVAPEGTPRRHHLPALRPCVRARLHPERAPGGGARCAAPPLQHQWQRGPGRPDV